VKSEEKRLTVTAFGFSIAAEHHVSRALTALFLYYFYCRVFSFYAAFISK